MSISPGSDGHNAYVRMVRGEPLEIPRIVGEHQPATEANGCGEDERVNGEFTARPCRGQGMSGSAGRPCAGGHDPLDTAGQLLIDCLVGAAAAVELQEDGGGYADRLASPLRRA